MLLDPESMLIVTASHVADLPNADYGFDVFDADGSHICGGYAGMEYAEVAEGNQPYVGSEVIEAANEALGRVFNSGSGWERRRVSETSAVIATPDQLETVLDRIEHALSRDEGQTCHTPGLAGVTAAAQGEGLSSLITLAGLSEPAELADLHYDLPATAHHTDTSLFGSACDAVYRADLGSKAAGNTAHIGSVFIARDAARARSGLPAWQWSDTETTCISGTPIATSHFDDSPENAYYSTPEEAFEGFCLSGHMAAASRNALGIDFAEAARDTQSRRAAAAAGASPEWIEALTAYVAADRECTALISNPYNKKEPLLAYGSIQRRLVAAMLECEAGKGAFQDSPAEFRELAAAGMSSDQLDMVAGMVYDTIRSGKAAQAPSDGTAAASPEEALARPDIAGLIRSIESAPDFAYDDQEAALNSALGELGLKWQWSSAGKVEIVTAAQADEKEGSAGEGAETPDDPIVLDMDKPLNVVLVDEEANLAVRVMYLDDNSYADYDIFISDLEANEISTSAAGLGTDEGGEGGVPYRMSEVLEAVNEELEVIKHPTRFSMERTVVLGDEEGEEFAELQQDKAYEALQAYMAEQREKRAAAEAESADVLSVEQPLARFIDAERGYLVELEHTELGDFEDNQTPMDYAFSVFSPDGRKVAGGFGGELPDGCEEGENHRTYTLRDVRPSIDGTLTAAGLPATGTLEPATIDDELAFWTSAHTEATEAVERDGSIAAFQALADQLSLEYDGGFITAKEAVTQLNTAADAAKRLAEAGWDVEAIAGQSTLKQVAPEMLDAMVDVWLERPGFDVCRGTFWAEDGGKLVCVDNSGSDCFAEEFATEDAAKAYLAYGLDLATCAEIDRGETSLKAACSLEYGMPGVPDSTARVMAEKEALWEQGRLAAKGNPEGASQRGAADAAEKKDGARTLSEQRDLSRYPEDLLNSAGGVSQTTVAELMDKLAGDAKIRQSAKVNSEQDFLKTVEDRVEDLLAEGYEQHEAEYNRLLSDSAALGSLTVAARDWLYPQLSDAVADGKQAAEKGAAPAQERAYADLFNSLGISVVAVTGDGARTYNAADNPNAPSFMRRQEHDRLRRQARGQLAETIGLDNYHLASYLMSKDRFLGVDADEVRAQLAADPAYWELRERVDLEAAKKNLESLFHVELDMAAASTEVDKALAGYIAANDDITEFSAELMRNLTAGGITCDLSYAAHCAAAGKSLEWLLSDRDGVSALMSDLGQLSADAAEAGEEMGFVEDAQALEEMGYGPDDLATAAAETAALELGDSVEIEAEPEKGAPLVTVYAGADKEIERADSQLAAAAEQRKSAAAASRGPKARFRGNVEAIRTLKELEASGEAPTPEQVEMMMGYVGWGGIAQAFDEGNERWSAEYAELKALLTDEEYSAARATTLTSFYTPPEVTGAVWEALQNLGFDYGRVLEPALGTGRFIDAMPAEMRENSYIRGIEKDSISGRLAAMTHPDVDVSVSGYEQQRLDNGSFDVAVSNVPFGDFRVYDPEYAAHNDLIHDYYFDKTLDKVRPGGVVAFITSTGTLDKASSALRRRLSQRAELIGAIRLPNDTFKREAGTSASSDIVFLQKLADGEKSFDDSWVETAEVGGLKINRYYEKHPEMILGTMQMGTGPGGRPVQECAPHPGHNLASELRAACQNLAGWGYIDTDENVAVSEGRAPEGAVKAPEGCRNLSFVVEGGEVYYHKAGAYMERAEVKNDADKKRLIALCAIRDSVRDLLEEEANPAAGDAEVEAKRAELNKVYGAYVGDKKLSGGSVHKHLKRLMGADSSRALLSSLEKVSNDFTSGKRVEVVETRAADIFAHRTVNPAVFATSADTPDDALAICLGEHGRVDMERIAELLGETPEAALEKMRGRSVFKDADGEYKTRDEFCSGHIAEKEERIRAYADLTGEDMSAELAALAEAAPEPIPAADIAAELGAPWIPERDIEDFIHETFKPSPYFRYGGGYGDAHSIRVTYSPGLNRWTVSAPKGAGTFDATTTYGTSDYNGYELLQDCLNLKDTVVYKNVYDSEYRQKKVVDTEATQLAQGKQAALRDAWAEWVWKDPARRERLEKKYNETFNALRLREFSPNQVRLVGANPAIKLEDHQLSAVARQLYGGNTLLYHAVGAGKTFEMAAACQEGKRLGLHSKAMILVPNHLTEQFGREYMELYPGANILVTGDDDYSKAKLEGTLARIATGDWDAVILGFSKMEAIPVSPETKRAYLDKQREALEEEIEQMRATNGDRRTVKQLEKKRANLEAKLEKLSAALEKGKVSLLTFEQLGIDRLFVDEAHYYKNLDIVTKMSRIRGLGNTDGAKKTADLDMKVQWLNEKTDYRGVTFATGTAVSNTMAEMYSLQRYLRPDELERMGLTSFDAWAATFARKETVVEIDSTAGSFKPVERLSRFQNLPELMTSFKLFADIKTPDQLNLPVPELTRRDVAIQPTEFQQEYVEDLGRRADAVHTGGIDPHVDNNLKITNDGRLLGLDPRLIDPAQPRPAGGKVETAAEIVLQNHANYNSFGRIATQMVFCDLSVPGKRGFCVYDDLREVLDAGMTVKVYDRDESGAKVQAVGEDGQPVFAEDGSPVWAEHDQFVRIPADEVKFIHEAGDKADSKRAMFAQLDSGEIKVLVGSTERMGAGTNAQRHLKAMVHMDCQWRPSDMEQREGRIVRRGNEWADDALDPGVIVSRLVTKGTFDSYMYQTVEAKQKFISQVFTDKAPVRVAEDIDDRSLNYAEIKAMATGNEEIREKMELDAKVGRLAAEQRAWRREQFALESNVRTEWPNRIERLKKREAAMRADAAAAGPKPGEKDVVMVVGRSAYESATEAAQALEKAALNTAGLKTAEIGSYRGFKVGAHAEWGDNVKLVLRGQGDYEVELGRGVGNITRLDNIIDKLAQRADEAAAEREGLETSLERAQGSVGAAWPKQEELAEAQRKLAEVNAKLNVGERANVAVSTDEAVESASQEAGYEFGPKQVKAINRAMGEKGKPYGARDHCLGLSPDQVAAFGKPWVPAHWMESMANSIGAAENPDQVAAGFKKHVTEDYIEGHGTAETDALALAFDRGVDISDIEDKSAKNLYARIGAQASGLSDERLLAWFDADPRCSHYTAMKGAADLIKSPHPAVMVELFDNPRSYSPGPYCDERLERAALWVERGLGMEVVKELAFLGDEQYGRAVADIEAGHDPVAAVSAWDWYNRAAGDGSDEIHERALRLVESGALSAEELNGRLRNKFNAWTSWNTNSEGQDAVRSALLDIVEAGAGVDEIPSRTFTVDDMLNDEVFAPIAELICDGATAPMLAEARKKLDEAAGFRYRQSNYSLTEFSKLLAEVRDSIPQQEAQEGPAPVEHTRTSGRIQQAPASLSQDTPASDYRAASRSEASRAGAAEIDREKRR